MHTFLVGWEPFALYIKFFSTYLFHQMILQQGFKKKYIVGEGFSTPKHLQMSQSPPIILTDKANEEVSYIAKFDIANKWGRRFRLAFLYP